MDTRAEFDWNDLRYFLAALRAGSLSGASRLLGVTHSTIGRRLAALESALGGALVFRSKGGLRPTPLGEKLLLPAEEIERHIAILAGLAQTQSAIVRLAVPSGFSRLFAARLGGFHRRHPHVELELLSGSRPLDLKNGEAELALRVGKIADPDLVARIVGTSGWSLYASRAYLARHPAPVDPHALAGHDVISFEASLVQAPGAIWLREHAAGANTVLRTREITEMVAAAVSGAGLAVLPCLFGDNEPDLVRLTPEVLGSHPISLVYRRGALLSAAVRAVRRFAIDVIREHSNPLSGVR